MRHFFMTLFGKTFYIEAFGVIFLRRCRHFFVTPGVRRQKLKIFFSKLYTLFSIFVIIMVFFCI
jgi:hypothetical protein